MESPPGWHPPPRSTTSETPASSSAKLHNNLSLGRGDWNCQKGSFKNKLFSCSLRPSGSMACGSYTSLPPSLVGRNTYPKTTDPILLLPSGKTRYLTRHGPQISRGFKLLTSLHTLWLMETRRYELHPSSRRFMPLELKSFLKVQFFT